MRRSRGATNWAPRALSATTPTESAHDSVTTSRECREPLTLLACTHWHNGVFAGIWLMMTCRLGCCGALGADATTMAATARRRRLSASAEM
jgi:hypothetical protein